MRRKFERIATSLALILVVAVGLRVTMTQDYVRQRPKQALAVIPFLFESGNIAYSLARGRGFASPLRVFTGPTAWMTPVYPFLLAGVLRLFGTYTFRSFMGAVALNIFFSALACVPLFYAGKRIGGARLGALAAWLWAVFPNANLLTFQSLWDASLDAFLGAAILWATLVLAANPRRERDWCGYGLLWGLTLMTNPVFAILLPFLLGWISYRHWKRGFPWARQVALTGLFVILCCLPWTVRNYEVFHALVPLRSVMGLQLWLGNNAETTPLFLGRRHPIFDSAEREKYTEMGEIAYMREKRYLALEYMAGNPRRVAELSARRFLAVWSGGTAYPVRDFFDNPDLWFRYVLLFNLFAAMGVLAGIVALWQSHSAYTFPLAVAPVVFPLPYYLSLVEPRYRLPIDPIVLLLLAVALHALLGGFRAATSPSLEEQADIVSIDTKSMPTS
ncbi:MAG: glycosyltransferase family 39 protein [Candidatus Acidiferrales bacterium]